MWTLTNSRLIALKCSHTTAENSKVDMSVLEGLPMVTGKFGFEEEQTLPTTVSANAKGGMNAALFIDYAESIFNVFPDMKDEPGKRVLVFVDGGPGRDNVEAYVEFADRGLYFLPLLPNCTHFLQMVDWLMGSFKIKLGKVKDILLQERGKQLCIADIPCILNGRGALIDDRTKKTERRGIISPCDVVFRPEIIRRAWEECGFYPLNRKGLDSKYCRRVVKLEIGDKLVLKDDVASAHLLEMEENHRKLLAEVQSDPRVTGSLDAFKITARRQILPSTRGKTQEERIRAGVVSTKMSKSGGKWGIVWPQIFSSWDLIAIHEMREQIKANIALEKEYKLELARFKLQEEAMGVWATLFKEDDVQKLSNDTLKKVVKYIGKWPKKESPKKKDLIDLVCDNFNISDEDMPKYLTQVELDDLKSKIGPTEADEMPIPVENKCFPARQRREKIEHVGDLIEQGKLSRTEVQELKKKVDKFLAP